MAREVFGDDFVDHFAGTREHEVRLWDEAVTDWYVRLVFSSVMMCHCDLADFCAQGGSTVYRDCVDCESTHLVSYATSGSQTALIFQAWSEVNH